MLDTLIVVLIILMVGLMIHSEAKYLFAKPTCSSCTTKDVKIPTLSRAKAQMEKAISSVKKETAKIQELLRTKDNAPDPVQFVDPIEHIAGSTNVVVGANVMENKIDEDLPFTNFDTNVPVETKAVDGTIKGIRPPTYADPRVMNPTLAAAPVQFSDPAVFGTFGVTDSISPAFSTPSEIPKTNARIAGNAQFEGFENALDANGARLVMNGKVVQSACQLPNYQLRDSTPHTTLPQRSLSEPPATVEDLVDGAMFEGLQGYPVNEKLDLLTPPGTAIPMSEFAAINYGVRNG
ncbi:hypothetical protein PBCVCVR1_815R [Paramecium bursaria Chlorella virus CVR-1]|uniref:Uncharacterized protein n=1 Tax=Paramecium bursaria Chlorella virus CVA-1 TaxID=42683 RepID=M1GYC8_9PHYC|nr:hypothetical protein F8205_gp197 [Paramecium bursaria Chlorella virus CVA-1]AGE50628.1 hypothetical protein PBCVCVA1_809R [Paramecium bursaria Chlorella virus CVA-1]AGE52307.1 hypothetical protein PBCVCVR1_815R [Paramecium bursaria Chlorella virus CVR-1]